MGVRRKLLLAAMALLAMVLPLAASAAPPGGALTATELVTGLAGGSGSTVGPDGALYVPEPAAGRISRVDPDSGDVTTYAEGLPVQLIPGLGGAMDVAFIGGTAYALVTLVGSDIGGSDTVGIYRVDGPDSFTVIADIGEFALDNPPDTDFDVPTGVQYALETYRGGFLVTDGHHNRVLHVTRDGDVSVFMAFGNIVPTGLAVWGNTVYMAEAGPVPHEPEDGKVVALEPGASTATEVASGAPLPVDVERGRGGTLFALAQGDFPCADPACAGLPALPNTGSLVKVNDDGTFTELLDELNQPTSLELIGTTAYVVTLNGEIWKIENVASPPFGKLQ
jgi:hypothetical protein